jgi:hypothetical protein
MDFKSHIEKTQLFSWKHIIYIRKGFKSYIEKILCYLFKLKYLNQNFFYPTLKKHNFFWEHKLYILMGFKSHIWKKNTRSCPGLPGSTWSWLTRLVERGLPGCCLGQSFIKSELVQQPGQPAELRQARFYN